MPNLIKIDGASIKVATKKEAATWLENIRGITGKSKADFARFIGTTPSNYQHIINAGSYPRFEILAILTFHGYNINQLININGGT